MNEHSKPPILVAAEADQEGRHICRVGVRVAKMLRSDLHLLNVIPQTPSIYADLNYAPLLECSREWLPTMVAENSQFFSSLSPRFCEHSVSVIEGHPSQTILEHAERLDSPLIVMGVHNRRGLQRLLGSTTHAVLNHCARDVLAVHPDGEDKSYQRVLIAVDTTDLGAATLRKAQAFAESAENVEIVSVIVPLAHMYTAEVLPSMDFSVNELSADIKRETTLKIKHAATTAGYSADVVQIETGDPRDEIIAAANRMNADLIVMGSNTRNALSRLFLGSTARAVLNRTPCDVLVCHLDD